MVLDSPKNKTYIYLLLILAGAIMYLPFLGGTHLFDWDEINFAECAREMIVSKNYFLVTIDFKPFWEKPPLFIWMQVLSMKALGVSDYAARLPNAICGIATLLLLFRIGTLLKDIRFGLIWVLVYACSILTHFYFKSGIIDPWFNFFIFTSIYFFVRLQLQNKGIMPANANLMVALSALFIGLAIMTKGPVAFLIFCMCGGIYWLMERRRAIISFPQGILFLVVLAIVGGSWFLVEILNGHMDIVKEFIQYQIRLFKTEDAGQSGPFYYHFLILLIGCFPASVFAIKGMMCRVENNSPLSQTKRWMSILFWVVLILFSIVKTKIIHYSSLCYYPLTFFSALAIYQLLNDTISYKKWMGWFLAIIGGVLSIAIAALPIAGMNADSLKPYFKDPFAVANLQAQVNWSYAYCLVGLCLLIGLVVFFILNKRNLRTAIIVLFVASMVTVNLGLALLAPKIELYSQQAAIEFAQSMRGKDAYLATLGYKSYAHYFYSDMQPWQNEQSTNENWLLNGKIDKPVYFISKIDRVDNYTKNSPDLKELYRKNGFVFLERLPANP